MTFRPTTLERAYQLAEGGDCATISEIKLRLQSEGFTNIQDQLFGLSTARALRDRCKASFRPRAEGDAVLTGAVA